MSKQFEFFGYNATTDGRYSVGGVEYFYGEDFRNVKRYKEYKDCGMTMLLLQGKNSYQGQCEFKDSDCYKCMSNAYKAGIDRVIVSDQRLKDICVIENLVGDNGKFKSDEELVEYVRDCVKEYTREPNFYGLQLFDEPTIQKLNSYGKVIKAIKKILPNVYLECNLLPMGGMNFAVSGGDELPEKFEKYLNEWVDQTGMDSICFDDYAFLREYILGVFTLRSYQIAAKVCKERGLSLGGIMQSFSLFSKEHLIHRRVTEPDMYWQLNLAMGFGAREFGFFTYMVKQDIPFMELGGIPENDDRGRLPMRAFGYPYGDGTCDASTFIAKDGSRTKLYYYTKRIMKEMQAFAPVIFKYNYNRDFVIFEKGKGQADFMQTKNAICNDGCPINVSPSYGVILVTEMINGDDKLYMVENISNIKEEYFNGKPAVRAKITLPSETENVTVYFRGKKIKKDIKDKTFYQELHAGDAIFIEITK